MKLVKNTWYIELKKDGKVVKTEYFGGTNRMNEASLIGWLWMVNKDGKYDQADLYGFTEDGEHKVFVRTHDYARKIAEYQPTVKHKTEKEILDEVYNKYLKNKDQNNIDVITHAFENITKEEYEAIKNFVKRTNMNFFKDYTPDKYK